MKWSTKDVRFIYHPELIERVVFLAARRDERRECELHERIDPLYAIDDAELRNQGFLQAYAQQFAAWGLGHAVEAAVRQLPAPSEIGKCVIAPAGRGNNQRLDLLVRSELGHTERNLFVQIRPEAVLDAGPILPWLRRELCHVADMLDPRFGYEPDQIQGSPWERKLRQDRYMVLWRV